MTEKTIRAEYPLTTVGERVLAMGQAVTALPAGQAGAAASYDRWIPIAVPGLIDGFDGQLTFVFSAACAYRGEESGTVLMVITEEQIRQATPPFQQCFVGFLDCRVGPPGALNPMELFDYDVRRAFVRQPMWSVPPAEQVAQQAIATMIEAWNGVCGGTGQAPSFEWVSGGWTQAASLDGAGRDASTAATGGDPEAASQMTAIPEGMVFRPPR